MRGRFIIFLVIVWLPWWANAQFSSEHAAMNSLRKGKWDKARAQLAKAIRKDSLNPTARYALSVYFFSEANPGFQIDSAYRYAIQALSDFQLETIRQRERLKKIPLDSNVLVRHRERIDSAAFERAKLRNTEAAYVDFLDRFPFAAQRTQAVELRDEVAFLDAMKENTYLSFLKYLEKYPASIRVPEARSRYEKLLFEARTKDRKLASFESFLLDYPATPYRKDTEKQIFEIMTASGESVDFEKFLKKYPSGSRANLAKSIWYHLLKDDERAIPRTLLSDSIQEIQQLEKSYLVPFLKDDIFGLMNEKGETVIKPIAKQIDDEYLCGNITDELLVLGNQILARNGAVIYQGDIQEVERLGYGFLKIRSARCVRVIHKSGFAVGEDCLQNARVISKNYLMLQKDNRWSVWTLTGRMLLDYNWDDIQRAGDVVIFKKSGRYKLARLVDIAKVADQIQIPFTQEFDEVKSWSGTMFWVRSGREEGVLNQNLKEWIKPDVQKVEPTFFGGVSQTSLGYKLHDRTSAPSQNFIHVEINQPWVSVQQNGAWRLIDPVTKQFESPPFDTITFNGPFSIGMRNDSLWIFLKKNDFISLPPSSRVQFLPGRDSLFFLLVEEGEKKLIYDAKGKQLFSVPFDKLEYNNEGFFTALQKNKRGLVTLNGKLIVQPEFDALGTVNHGVVQVLKERKFGLLDVVRRKEIKAEYDKNLVPYNNALLIASKNGLYGLIGWDNKPTLPFEYEEIRYWNDSSALVKKNFNWIIYNFVENRIVMDRIKNLKKVLDSEQEKIMIVQQENKFGVISNRKGVTIPATFTDIVNLGSATVPLYFTEKHVEEASLFVVIYYDKDGVQLLRQVFEADDYDKIYCSGN